MLKMSIAACALTLICGATALAQSADKSKTVTVTGCVKSGGKSGEYLLTGGMSTGGSNTGVTSPANAGTVESVYALTSSDDLKPHVGHKVEVTGMLTPAARRKSKGGGREGIDGTVSVSNVKMISTSCP